MAVDFQKSKQGTADAKEKLSNIKKAKATGLIDRPRRSVRRPMCWIAEHDRTARTVDHRGAAEQRARQSRRQRPSHRGYAARRRSATRL